VVKSNDDFLGVHKSDKTKLYLSEDNNLFRILMYVYSQKEIGATPSKIYRESKISNTNRTVLHNRLTSLVERKILKTRESNRKGSTDYLIDSKGETIAETIIKLRKENSSLMEFAVFNGVDKVESGLD
jgi:hypothetical protein